MDDLLERPSADRREAFVLTQLVGLPDAEAAAVAGVPVGTIRSRVARARADLVAALAEPDGVPLRRVRRPPGAAGCPAPPPDRRLRCHHRHGGAAGAVPPAQRARARPTHQEGP